MFAHCLFPSPATRPTAATRGFAALALAALLLAAPCPASSRSLPTQAPPANGAKPPVRPNLIYILLDDVGRGDLGAYGSTTTRTPNIDRLSAEGMRFEQHYALSPICSPSRVALLTGRYPASIGVRSILSPGETHRGIPSYVPMLSEVLGREGYRTAHIGKWHVGVARPEYTPATRFDHWIRSDGRGYVDPMLAVDDQPPFQATGHLTELLTDRVIEFIEESRGRPFFINLWYYAAHTPLQAPRTWLRQYPTGKPGKFSGLLGFTDHQIGRILDALTRFGLDESTLVILGSDNGSHHGSNAPFGGSKGSLREGGIRTPHIARWTDTIPAGSVNRGVTADFDVFATLIDLLGIDPEGLELHGQSLAEALLHNRALERERALIWDYQQRFAMRRRNWKLHQVSNTREANPVLNPKLIDIVADPRERNDLRAQKPELVRSMLDEYRDWRRSMGTIEVELGRVEGKARQQQNGMHFDGGRIVLADHRLLDFNDGDFSFRGDLELTKLGEVQLIAQLPGAWELQVEANGALTLALYSAADGAPTILSSSTPLTADSPTPIAFTVTGHAGGRGIVRLYSKGSLVAESHDVDVVRPAAGPLALGNDSQGSRPLRGTLRRVQFYSLPLWLSEIQQ